MPVLDKATRFMIWVCGRPGTRFCIFAMGSIMALALQGILNIIYHEKRLEREEYELQ